MSTKMSASVRTTFLLWVVLLSGWLIPPASYAFRAIVKSSDLRCAYTVCFFALLYLLILFLTIYSKKIGLTALLMVGAIGGYIAGFLSVNIAVLVDSGGFEAFANVFSRFGFFQTLFVHAWIALLTGGAVFGFLSAVALQSVKRIIKFKENRFARPSQ